MLPPLNKRGTARFKQGPVTIIRGIVIERGEDAPYPIGYPLDCHLMHHEIPFERPNTESSQHSEKILVRPLLPLDRNNGAISQLDAVAGSFPPSVEYDLSAEFFGLRVVKCLSREF
jgi:hypothetical protein